MENDSGITEGLIQDILKNVKLVLGISDTSKDDLLTLYINMMCNNILILTNRRVFVKELKYVVINLVVDKFDTNNARNIEDIQTIQSMSEYDRTVNFGVSDILRARLNALAQKQLEENQTLINRYKLLYRVNLQPKKVGELDE